MGGLERVVFWFGTAFEVRYLPDYPAPGDRVTHAGDLWTVESLEPRPSGVYVICELPAADKHHLDRVA